MNKISLILKYFQKKDQLTTKNRDYQRTVSTLFGWLTNNDKVTDDKTTKYFPNKETKAIIIAKQNGIIAGLEETGYLLDKYTKLIFLPKTKDGSRINNLETIAEIKGKSHDILAYERTILNILQRMSGVATETNRMIKGLKTPQGWPVSKDSPGVEETEPIQHFPFIAATRKTPWMEIDKKAAAVGDGLTHRLNLSDGILIKDNHLKLLTIERTLETLLKRSDPAQRGPTSMELIETEVESEKQAHIAIKTFQRLNTCNYLAILLDNFSPQMAKLTLDNLKKKFDLSKIIFEASGGIDKNNISAWSKTGVDIISIGSLTHSTHTLNLSLEFVTK